MNAQDRIASREDCVALDEKDPLKNMRAEFDLPADTIYLDGNSLGALPTNSAERVHNIVHKEWGQDLIRSWNEAGWFDKPRTVGDRVGSLVGAAPGNVVVCDSTSVNLYKTLIAALGMQQDRNVIISDADNFPTDLYMIQGAMELLGGYERRLISEAGPSLEEVLDDQVAVVVLTQVNYRTGKVYDMAEVTKQVRSAGALIIWDLCHSVGAIPVELDACDVDFAVGCTYKYLNGGPGSPAFVYAAPRLQDKVQQPLSGWHGHASPFTFDTDYVPGAGMTRFVVGTPPLISYASLEGSLEVWEKTDMAQIRQKSVGLTSLFIQLVDDFLGDHVGLLSPRDVALRGSQVSLSHENGYAVMQALIESGVIGDFRAPNLIRFGFAPLYVGYAEVWDAVQVLKEILEDERWKQPKYNERQAVT